jgi:hypothetical protein
MPGKTAVRGDLRHSFGKRRTGIADGAPFGSRERRSKQPQAWQRPVNLSQRRLHVIVNAFISSANYTILAQSRNELMVPENSPSISMWPYLLSSSQTRRLNKISVYADRGTSREQSRLLYMNANALSVWREMGMPATVIGESHRPPHSAMLSFGMPFSE